VNKIVQIDEAEPTIYRDHDAK